METFTIREALEDDPDYPPRQLAYVVRDGDTVFYVGQSISPFARLVEHIEGGRSSPSELGRCIVANAPESDSWVIQLWYEDDCRPQVTAVFPNVREDWGSVLTFARDLAEQALIKALRPCLNITYNPNPQPLPKSYK